jgi:hypothetical protein
MFAVATLRTDVKSFRLAQPPVRPSATHLTACTTLTLSAAGVWLLVLPLELVRFAAS